MTDAAIGHNAKVQRADGDSPANWSDLGELIDPGSHATTRDAVDATHAQSEGRFREYISGLRDGGEFTFTLALLAGAATYASLHSDIGSDTIKQYRFLFPNGTSSWEFYGFITNLGDATPIDDRMTTAVTIKVSGRPNLYQ